MRDRPPAGDPHFDEANGILRNVRGFTDQAQLDRFERRNAIKSLLRLERNPVRGQFDRVHLQTIHRRIFEQTYPWAGELRKINISRPASYPFARIEFMQKNLDATFEKLSTEEHLKSLQADAFANRAAFYLGELNSLHPFREGNGRTQREFIRELAAEAGFSLDWSQITQKQMYEASQVSHNLGRNSRFAELIRLALQVDGPR
jgi:cell filamentation protein